MNIQMTSCHHYGDVPEEPQCGPNVTELIIHLVCNKCLLSAYPEPGTGLGNEYIKMNKLALFLP